ncbi:EI24 domain-containing protein [Pedomonas mirosovicensis]|uniref:EI24 domain-containing protein n=1 Tax=Pedomonas mirosovicensis TaxID=2908641 RepID=UPI00216A4A8B|nr:EI24 domain-containing protein [Pedomonas mirosovicensis]MCH8684038.1 EI24 domain-containing protein [Pedomonas mirosovicensis]
MLRALALSVAQLSDRRFLRIFLAATGLALVLFGLLWWGIDWGLAAVSTTGWPAWLARAWGWLENALAILGLLAALWFLFPAVATGIMALFLDSVVDAVEDRHYPADRAPRDPSLAENALLGLRSFLRLVGYNLLALPLYIFLLFTGLGPLILFLAINSALLGRDMIEMVTVRHLSRHEREAFRTRHGWLILQVGILTTLLFLVPIVNLFAPLMGAALATHAFHRTRGERP